MLNYIQNIKAEVMKFVKQCEFERLKKYFNLVKVWNIMHATDTVDMMLPRAKQTREKIGCVLIVTYKLT